MSLLNKIKNKKRVLSTFADGYGYLIYAKLNGPIKNRMYFNGKEVIVWSYNDYLGLSCDEKVIEAETEVVKEYGASYPGGSRLLAGNTESHEQLEAELGRVTGKSTLLVNLLYVGTISIIQSLLDRNDSIIYDQEVHASIIDGVRLHLGNRLSFQHNNVEHLRTQLEKTKTLKKSDSEVLVVVDGVYSMAGDIAKLQEIVKLKETYDFTLLVDDSHGFLVFGDHGTPGALGVMENVDLYISTFGKALGNVGGVVAGNKVVIDYLKYSLRSQIFGRSLSTINVKSVLFKLDLLKKEGEKRKNRLWENTKLLQSGLKEIGMNIGNTESPITPVYLEGLENLDVISTLREEHGVFCSGVTYPVIAKGKLLLRLIPTALHTQEDIHQTVNAFRSVLTNL